MLRLRGSAVRSACLRMLPAHIYSFRSCSKFLHWFVKNNIVKQAGFAAVLAGALLAVACGSSRAVYKFQVNQVSRGDSVADDSRNIQRPLVYENADFKVTWAPGALTYYFRIDNKSKTDLLINFDRTFLISPGGNTFMAIHPGNSAISKGDSTLIIPALAGVDSWVRPGPKQGENHGGLAGALSPGFDGGGFFPEYGEAAELKQSYTGKNVTVVLNILKGGKAENFRFILQVADVAEQ